MSPQPGEASCASQREFGIGVAVGHDARARIRREQAVIIDARAAQRDQPLAIAVLVDPSHRPGVAAAVGCNAATMSSALDDGASCISTSVARCQRFGSLRVNGRSLAETARACGRSVSSTLCTAKACSSRSLPLVAN